MPSENNAMNRDREAGDFDIENHLTRLGYRERLAKGKR